MGIVTCHAFATPRAVQVKAFGGNCCFDERICGRCSLSNGGQQLRRAASLKKGQQGPHDFNMMLIIRVEKWINHCPCDARFVWWREIRHSMEPFVS